MSSNAGGSATNAGIDFQQRISALFLTHMLLGVVFIDDLGMEESATIKSLHFESSEPIDDLVVKTDAGIVYIQAKRSISCSDAKNSEFSKVIKQFVAQYLKDPEGYNKFVLATSSKASSKITRDLRKILESIKCNDTGFTQNPLNKSEQSVFDILSSMISVHYTEHVGEKILDKTRLKILSKMHVSVIDIEDGMPLENAVISLISGKSTVSPKLLWSTLITLGLKLSKDRSSINQGGLKEKVGRFVSSDSRCEKNCAKKGILEAQMKNSLSSGREVVLVKAFTDDADYFIIELIRFDEDGKKRVSFFENKVELLNGETCDVICRASTYAAVERFILKNEEDFAKNRIHILPINSEEDIENSPIAKSHSEHCSKLLESKEDPFICIHCGDPISSDQSLLIEIDENESHHDVGLIHDSCRNSIDRILGVLDAELFREYPHLKNFNYESWYSCIYKGQGLFAGLSSLPKRVYPIAWKANYVNLTRGMHCVKINLEDGSSWYVTERGKVLRKTEDSAATSAADLNVAFEEAKVKKDPWCVTSNKSMFATYSTALENKDDDEECLLCTNAEPVKYTNAINKAYSFSENFYTPLILLLDKNSGLPIDMGGAIFMISTPLSLESYLKNWGRADLKLPDYSITIIKSDAEFDKIIQDFKSDGLTIVIDPELNMKGELTSGFVVENINDIALNKPYP